MGIFAIEIFLLDIPFKGDTDLQSLFEITGVPYKLQQCHL
jgi:hypothetical protein